MQVLKDTSVPSRTLLNCCNIITQLCTLPGGLIAYTMKQCGIMAALLHTVSNAECSDSGVTDAARNAAYTISTAASRASIFTNHNTPSLRTAHYNGATSQEHDDRTDEPTDEPHSAGKFIVYHNSGGHLGKMCQTQELVFFLFFSQYAYILSVAVSK
jgi:hypothetical protein